MISADFVFLTSADIPVTASGRKTDGIVSDILFSCVCRAMTSGTIITPPIVVTVLRDILMSLQG